MSQLERVFNHLQIFGFITNQYASDEYHIHHLPGVIRDIKKKFNAKFDEEWLSGVDQYGEKTRWKKYILIREPQQKFWELDK